MQKGSLKQKERTDMEWLKMELSPDFAFVPGIRSCISRAAYNFGFDDREAYHIEMIADEICNNAVEYGSKNKDGKIKLECRFLNNQMELVVTDYGGKKFDVDQELKKGVSIIQPAINRVDKEEPTRGRGLIIVKKLADRLDIKTGKNGTQVSIVKKKGASLDKQ